MIIRGIRMTKCLSRGLVKFGGLCSIIGFVLCTQLAGQANANFTVGRDTFNISNSPGYCFAMAAFSRWYYIAHRGGPPLRAVLTRQAQQRLARELQYFYSKNLISIQADYCNKFHRNQGESFKYFLSGLMMGEPRLILLMNRGKKGIVLHAVLAYEWLPRNNMVKVYDPNYIDQVRLIDLDQRRYTSLDITYSEICFPEVLNDHSTLVAQMEKLYETYIGSRVVSPNGGGPRPPEGRTSQVSRNQR
jgi:hypothetical protein